MAVPFRIGVMQLTMEPLDEMLASARAMDDAGMDTIWLAEAYPWWRKHGMEARSSTVVSALIARGTKQLTGGWGLTPPVTASTAPLATAAGESGRRGAAGGGAPPPRAAARRSTSRQPRRRCRRSPARSQTAV